MITWKSLKKPVPTCLTWYKGVWEKLLLKCLQQSISQTFGIFESDVLHGDTSLTQSTPSLRLSISLLITIISLLYRCDWPRPTDARGAHSGGDNSRAIHVQLVLGYRSIFKIIVSNWKVIIKCLDMSYAGIFFLVCYVMTLVKIVTVGKWIFLFYSFYKTIWHQFRARTTL